MTPEEVLKIFILPVAVAILPLVWAASSAWLRRHQFRELILRELEQVGPHPPEKKDKGGKWTDHHPTKKFIHPAIFENPTENRDFILSLPADLVYYATQLWNSKEDHEQWLYFLQQIEKKIPWWERRRRTKFARVRKEWCSLMTEYCFEHNEKLGLRERKA